MSSARSCRILTISSSVTQAKQLAERVIGASNSAEEQSSSGSKEGQILQLPWTISNKYYTAPVHFTIAQTADIQGEDAVDVPACIFVFSLAESFKEQFTSLTARLEDSDFEVSIAVSVPSPSAASSTDDEQDALEAFFGEHGFEYVNGHSSHDITQEHDIDDMEGIPGIGRVVDALSTILWPSMVQKASSRRSKTRSVVSVPGPPGEEDGLRSLLNADNGPTADISRQREMAVLEKWLEEGADDEKDPWAGMAQGQMSQLPSEEDSKHEFSQPPASGFDDNFSDFVSAPAQGHADADADSALPSQAEVELMSQRIRDMASTEDMDDSESDSPTPFDLSRVLGALEAMKEEIAGIANEDEKRMAAAKVALGLVYGLDEG